MTMTKQGQPVRSVVVTPPSPPIEKPKGKSGPKPETKKAAVEAAEAPAEPPAPLDEEVGLGETDTALVQLAQERVLNAQLHLNNRQREFETLLGQIKAKYEQGGGYRMKSIDVSRGVIVRSRA